MRKWLSDRNTGDFLVVLIAGTVCTMVLVGGLSVVFNGVFRPGTTNPAVIAMLSDAVNTLIGLLAGFVAGRNDRSNRSPLDPPLPGTTTQGEP